jgi:uncharacterized protein YegL
VHVYIDVSGSMSGRSLREAKTALRTFYGKMREREGMALNAFNGSVQLVQKMAYKSAGGGDEAFASAVESMAASGGTALYDALVHAAAAVERSTDWCARHGKAERRQCVLLLTDGEESGASEADFEAARIALRRCKAKVWVVALGQARSVDAIKELDKARRVEVIDAEDASHIADAFQRVMVRMMEVTETVSNSVAASGGGGGGNAMLLHALTGGGAAAAAVGRHAAAHGGAGGAAALVCAKCHAPVDRAAAFCSACGKRLAA